MVLAAIAIILGAALAIYTTIAAVRGRVTAYAWYPISLVGLVVGAIGYGIDGEAPGLLPIERWEKWFWPACLFNWAVAVGLVVLGVSLTAVGT